MKLLLLSSLLILLLLCSLSDIRWRKIPNSLVILILGLGVLHMLLYGSVLNSVTGLLLPAAPLLLLRRYYSSIGAGDIKLIATVGVWLGGLLNLSLFMAACLLCALVLLLKRAYTDHFPRSVPFAPFLAIPVIMSILWVMY
ncbi:prepilin peptidase [Paenibacillus albidus]|uniref:prepilin peptidase n=1 Tax=Paenibacillus albidus TaxID=2041023 RepID=UPI001BE890CE|nr:prepilin peptidase [Paenibacillus albidus]MBT2293159.1 prepilin peptidase [Paenibacillus albidus]